MDKAKVRELREMILESRRKNEAFALTPEGRATAARMEVARNVNELIRQRKITQAHFCELIHMKPPQFNRIIRGEENITVDTASRIADGFGVHISRLYRKVCQSTPTDVCRRKQNATASRKTASMAM